MPPDSRSLIHQAEPLWACHGCEMIGNQQEAHGHQQAHGHDIEELSQEISDRIREAWRTDQLKRAAAWLAWAPAVLATRENADPYFNRVRRLG